MPEPTIELVPYCAMVRNEEPLPALTLGLPGLLQQPVASAPLRIAVKKPCEEGQALAPHHVDLTGVGYPEASEFYWEPAL